MKLNFYWERKLWKKYLLLRSELEPGSDALQTTAFTTEPLGLWQLWTSNLALLLLIVAVSVDYTVRDHGHQGYLEKANRLRHYKIYLLYSFSYHHRLTRLLKGDKLHCANVN